MKQSFRTFARTPPIVRFLPVLLLVQPLAGCSGDSSDAEPLPPDAPSPTAEAQGGRFVGTVTIGAVDYFGDALFTVDGAVRLYIGGPYSATGSLQVSRPDSSVQFVGNVAAQDGRAIGDGVIIGQGCAAPHHTRFCDETASAEISAAIDSSDIQGEMQVATNAGSETWILDLHAWNWYESPASVEYVAAQYSEELAEFAADGAVIVSIDQAGRLFFQSALSGCVGNGTLAPHLDGAFNVFDVTLMIENCTASYAYLNGDYEGLATETPSGYWDYDSLLRTWVSKREGAPSKAAITLLGSPL